jgi:hypothetical protein
MATYSLLFGHAEWREDAETGPAADARQARGERLTLRVPSPLRRRIETSAARDGLAPDEWASLVLVRALDGTPTSTAR